MCGIAGIYAYHCAANSVRRNELLRMRDHMAARGPDSAGQWFSGDGRVALGHRRLSIIDLAPRSTQPMASGDGTHIVTFNGEIYNYRALRRGLEAEGCVFRTQSDTEVLLHLYAVKGEAMVHALRGMFAFAIWDERRGRLFAARDRFGIKPFYYVDDGWNFRFASQVKALIAGGGCSKDTDPAGLAGFYLFGAVPEPFTTYAGVRALPAGCHVSVDHTGVGETKRYYSIAEAYRSLEAQHPARGEALEAVRASLLDSVRHHLVAEAPVGLFLSAGIDSGAIAGLMRDAGQGKITTVTLGFSEFVGTSDDETPLAARVAAQYEAHHHQRLITEREFMADLPAILEAMDQPSIDGFNSWFVSKAASELGLKVALSGLGGDELLGGYPSFEQVPRLARALRWPGRIPLLPAAARRLAAAAPLARFDLSPKLAGLLEYGGTVEGAYLLRRGLFMPWELPRILGRDLAAEGLRRLQPLRHLAAADGAQIRSGLARVAMLETAIYMRNQLLRDTDWASMAHSLEVRVPFVDHRLLETCGAHILNAAADEGGAKSLIAKTPTKPLPADVVHRRKTGFSTPVARWIGRAGLTGRSPQRDARGTQRAPARALAQLVLAR